MFCLSKRNSQLQYKTEVKAEGRPKLHRYTMTPYHPTESPGTEEVISNRDVMETPLQKLQQPTIEIK